MIFYVNLLQNAIIISWFLFHDYIFAEIDGKKDLVQPNEKHYEGIPKFLQEPLPIYYVNSTHPVEIVCVAESVSHVNIFCADKQFSYMGEEVSDSGLHVIKLNTENKPDSNGKRWRFSLILKLKDVLEWFSEYKCYCESWNQIIAINKAKKVHSSAALIQESYFQNKFKKSPQSQTIEEGSRLILSCVAPDAKPNAKITWLKDNQLIARTNVPQIIITDQNRQLIIERVKKTDKGNYSCAAHSLGVVKKTKAAVISVTSKYYWSQWTEWISCPAACVGENACLNQLCANKATKRLRFCLNNGAKTNAENCRNEPVDVVPCDVGCDQSDKWKAWTEWSIACSPNCSQTRMRRCDSTVCKGIEVENKNCSRSLCQKKESSSSKESQSTTMYLALFATISVLFTIILVILCLVVQKGYINLLPRRSFGFSSHNNGVIKSYGNESAKSKKLLINCDDKSTALTIKSHNNEQPVSTTLMDNCSNTYSPVYEIYPSNERDQVLSEMYSEYPILSPPPFQSPMATNGISKDRLFNGIIKNRPISNDRSSRPSSALYQELSIGHGPYEIQPNYLPTNIGLDTVAWGTISSSGGRLSLPQSGISLTIPRGVIHHGNVEEVFLTVCRDQTIIPVIDDSELLLSPIIVFGPHNLKLSKPLIISLPHCANTLSNNWMIRVLGSDYQNNQIPPMWKELSSVRLLNKLDEAVYVQLDPVSAHIMTNKSQLICITGQLPPVSLGPVWIRLRIMSFSKATNSEPIHIIKLHIIPDTKEAIENVSLSEAQLGGQMLDHCKTFSFSSLGGDISMCLEDLSLGWRCHGKLQVLSHLSIWRINHSKSFEIYYMVEQIDPNKPEFSCNISVQQVDVPQSRVNINIIKENIGSVMPVLTDSPETMTLNSDFSQTYLDPLQTVFRISLSARQRLWPLLDPYWQILVNHMNLNGNIKYFEERNSPSDTILDLWEARCREEGDSIELIKTLNLIGRSDCAIIVEQDVMSRSTAGVLPL